MVARRQTDNRRLQEVRIVCAKIQLAELIRQPQATVVSDVKEVGDKADSRAVVDHPRIIRVEIKLAKETAFGRVCLVRPPEIHRH